MRYDFRYIVHVFFVTSFGHKNVALQHLAKSGHDPHLLPTFIGSESQDRDPTFFQHTVFHFIPLGLAASYCMILHSVHLNCQNRRFIHFVEQKKIYVRQRVGSISDFRFREHGVVLHQSSQRRMHNTVHF